ncbi:MAG TPA: flagellar basal-body rod protein FlgF [Candidatus Goldiibacteriota bacterium]|nr:flagellar basal-body rod protein FlgF [Candidatus Goldiibacteriota bacterium]
MISGLYTAASGLIAQAQQQDVIANNLSNVNTTGYKKDTAIYMPFPTVFLNRINDEKNPMPGGGFIDAVTPIGMTGRGVQLISDGVVPKITEEGSFIQTDNALDMAIKGNAMFVVMTPQGIKYTRDGSFTLDSEGMLVTKNGYPVMGERGEIHIEGKDIRVDDSGRIYADKNELDTLRLAVFTKEDALRKQGDNLFYLLGGDGLSEDYEPGEVSVKQGYLESSNVNVVREMVDMITSYRAYEASQKAIQAHDQTLSKAVNDVGHITI